MSDPESRSELSGDTPGTSQPVDDYLPGHLLRGILMGCADSVPGISGGTVALVLGIYQRLVMAISRFDRQFLRLLARRAWRQAAAHVDLSFLVSLLGGALIGLLMMTTLAHQLLKEEATRPFTLAIFLGMMLACTWLVARPLRPRNGRQWWTLGGIALLAGLLGWRITMLPASFPSPEFSQLAPPELPHIFLAGLAGICAMILPGISGAMILMMMGFYFYLTGIPADLFAGRQVGLHMVEIAVFFAGCLTGLMIFCRLLRYLLVQFHSITMAFLCGAMVGSMRALWPFQRHDPGSQAIEYYFPSQFDTLSLGVILAVAFGVMLVISSRLLAGAHKKAPS